MKVAGTLNITCSFREKPRMNHIHHKRNSCPPVKLNIIYSPMNEDLPNLGAFASLPTQRSKSHFSTFVRIFVCSFIPGPNLVIREVM
jgi:hypothetical protein